MKVTVIMPLYNHAAYVGEALRSLLAQKDDCDLDILVIDDGSTDGSGAIVAEMARVHPQIRLVATPNQGVVKARNVGLRNLPDDCEFVTFCDSDDVSPPGRLRTDLAAFDAAPEVQLTFARILITRKVDPETLRPASDAPSAEVRNVHLGAAIFRRGLVDRIGFFDEAMIQGEDLDYLLRCFETGVPYRIMDTIAVYYRLHGSNMTRRRDIVRQFLIEALRRSMQRRRRDPSLRLPPDLFDLMQLRESAFEILDIDPRFNHFARTARSANNAGRA